MGRRAAAGVAIGCLAALLGGCHRTDPQNVAEPTGSAVSAVPTAPAASDVDGVEPTLRGHIPPDALLCLSPVLEPGTPVTVRVADPAAPIIQLTAPDGWEIGAGEPLPLTGPDGLVGAVAVVATELEPAAAFTDYASELRRAHPDLQVEVGPAQFCGYSGQLLTGTLRGPDDQRAFADRITHIWTNTANYLVSVRLEGPDGAPGFDAAKAVLTQQFTVTIP